MCWNTGLCFKGIPTWQKDNPNPYALSTGTVWARSFSPDPSNTCTKLTSKSGELVEQPSHPDRALILVLADEDALHTNPCTVSKIRPERTRGGGFINEGSSAFSCDHAKIRRERKACGTALKLSTRRLGLAIPVSG